MPSQRGYPGRGGLHPQNIRNLGSPGASAMTGMSPGVSMGVGGGAGSGGGTGMGAMMRTGTGYPGMGGRPSTPSDGSNFNVVSQGGQTPPVMMFTNQLSAAGGVPQYRRTMSQPSSVMPGKNNKPAPPPPSFL